MDLNEVKDFLEKNADSPDVQEYLQGFKQISVEDVQNLVKTNKEFTSWLDSEKDKHYSKALETFKQKTMPKIIEDEIAKRNPSNKTPEQLERDQAIAEAQKWKSKMIRESVKNNALKFAAENKIPSDIIDYFITLENEDDEEGTKSKEVTMRNLNNLKDIWSKQLQSVVDEKLKSNGFTPKDINTPTIKSFEEMSMDEYKKARSGN